MPTNKNVHGVGRTANDHAQTNEGSARDRDITATEQIRQGSDEGADGGETKQVGKDLSINMSASEA